MRTCDVRILESLGELNELNHIHWQMHLMRPSPITAGDGGNNDI